MAGRTEIKKMRGWEGEKVGKDRSWEVEKVGSWKKGHSAEGIAYGAWREGQK